MAPITLFENTSCNLINIFSKLNFLILQSSNLNSFMDDHLYSSFSCTTSPIHAATSKEIFLKKISERTYLRTSSFRHFSCYTFFYVTVRFLWCLTPLLLLLFFTQFREKVERNYKFLIWSSIEANALCFFLATHRLGKLKIVGFVLNTSPQIAIFSSLGLITIKSITSDLPSVRQIIDY